MNSVKVTYELPAELVERAKALGVDIEGEIDGLVELIEKRIRKAEAIRKLDEITAKIDALPDEMKLTKEDIEAEIRAYHAERAAQQK